jgi:hypothetical protein
MQKQPTKSLLDRLNLLVMENPTPFQLAKLNMAILNATKYVPGQKYPWVVPLGTSYLDFLRPIEL